MMFGDQQMERFGLKNRMRTGRQEQLIILRYLWIKFGYSVGKPVVKIVGKETFGRCRKLEIRDITGDCSKQLDLYEGWLDLLHQL